MRPVRNEKIKACSPFDPANPLYYRLLLSIYTVNVSGKLSQGGTIFSKLKKMCGQNPFRKKNRLK